MSKNAGSDMMHARGVTLVSCALHGVVLALVLWAGAAAASEFEGDAEAAECLVKLGRPDEAARHIDQYLTRADEADLPEEEEDRRFARELQQRIERGSSSD